MLQKDIEAALCDALSKIDQNIPKSVILRKKGRNLAQGDIVFPAGCVKLNKSDHDKLILLMEEFCVSADTMATKVSSDKYNLLSFFIDRPVMCGLVVKEILASDIRFGKSEGKPHETISVHTVSFKKTTSLTDLRMAVVLRHATKLLEANGYTINCGSQRKTFEYEEMVQKFLVKDKSSKVSKASASSANKDPQSMSQTRQCVLSRLCFPEASEDQNNSCESPADTEAFRQMVNIKERKALQDILKCEGQRNVLIDLQSVISSLRLHIGKGGFEANLKDIQVLQDGQPTEVLEESLKIIHYIAATVSPAKHHCLHIVPHNGAFYDQQIILTTQGLVNTTLTQSQMVIGPVIVQDASQTSLSAEEFYKSRLKQFKEASEMRKVISSDECSEDDAKTLTDASIKIDILGNACHSPLTLENTASGRGAESRLGAFILYNTARLSTLLQRFEQAVAEGFYPALPSVDLIDWTLLREEEDWELVYVYLAAFPEIVSQSVECIIPADGKLSAKIHTHKVTNFLVSFCKCLSAHYSRYHILTGREAHLLPLMYARLYMMKAAHQVLLHSLDLLGIRSLSYV